VGLGIGFLQCFSGKTESSRMVLISTRIADALGVPPGIVDDFQVKWSGVLKNSSLSGRMKSSPADWFGFLRGYRL
jgi:hypothetical protein